MAASPDSDFNYPAPSEAVGPYLHAVKRHWRLVLGLTVLALLVAGFTLSRSNTTYSARASILVTPLPEGDSSFVGIGTVVDTSDPTATIQTAAALIDSPEAAALAARQLGPPWTQGSVERAVTVAPEGGSSVVGVTATASSGTDAQRVANAYANSAVAYRARVVQAQIAQSISQLQARLDQLTGAAATSAQAEALATGLEQLRAVQGTNREPTMSVSQTAGTASANGTSKALVLLLALLAGFAVGSVLALALETFSGPVRDREELETLYPLPVLAALPEVSGRKRRGGSPPWTLPATTFEQMRMLRIQLSQNGGGPVIMVTSAGAGDGKTTVAAALSAAYAEAGQRVLLMDLDLRKPELSELLGVQGLAFEDDDLEDMRFATVLVPRLPNVRLLRVSRANLRDFERLIAQLPALLTRARERADVVIVDVAPIGEVGEALRIGPFCDQILMVARPRHTDRRRLSLARDLLERAGLRPAGLVLIGKELGLPPSDKSYAYEMTMGAANGRADQVPVSGVAAGEAGVAGDDDSA